jgi:(2Fe-2S) ferredoxin
VGGHKYSGNVILCFPDGRQIWYGRVIPAYIKPIIKETILEGKIIPELLRGGYGLNKRRKTLEW